jgi:hypothetical protein
MALDYSVRCLMKSPNLVINLLLLGLGAHPENPPVCCGFLCKTITVLTHCEGAPEAIRSHPRFLAEFIKLISAPHPPNEFCHFIKHLQTCRCHDLKDPAMSIIRNRADSHFKKKPKDEWLLHAVGLMFSYSQPNFTQLFWKPIKGANSSWPRSASNLMPFDPLLTIQAIAVWDYIPNQDWEGQKMVGELVSLLIRAFTAQLVPGVLLLSALWEWIDKTLRHATTHLRQMHDQDQGCSSPKLKDHVANMHCASSLILDIQRHMFDNELLYWLQNR